MLMIGKGSVQIKPDDYAENTITFTVVDTDGLQPDLRYDITAGEFIPAVMEMAVSGLVHNFEALSDVDLPPEVVNVMQAFAEIKWSVLDDTKEVQATIRNGDTGDYESSVGSTLIQCICNLAVQTGFESVYIATGKWTLQQWFWDYQYGIHRKSQELLDEEMAELASPDRGAW